MPVAPLTREQLRGRQSVAAPRPITRPTSAPVQQRESRRYGPTAVAALMFLALAGGAAAVYVLLINTGLRDDTDTPSRVVPAVEADLEGEGDDGSGDAVPGMNSFDLGIMYGRDLAADGIRQGSSHCSYEGQVRYGENSPDASQFFRGCMFGVGG
jgi:hypothetical protein